MLVDDHAAFREMVRTLLRTTDAAIIECEDGWEAATRYADFQPDIVLMDLAMPGLDGLGATAQIKARFPTARIVILTQYDDPDLRLAARQAGACDCLSKHDLSRLDRLVQAWTSCIQTDEHKSV